MMGNFKKISVLLLFSGVSIAAPSDVCKSLPGSILCGKGTVSNLIGNGMVDINGTTITGHTSINGLVNASDANFYTIEVNGNVNLTQCTINNFASIKGMLTAASTKFENSLEVYSSEVRFTNSKINKDLNVRHTDSSSHMVFLDNFSEVNGNIIFDDGNGEVILRGGSKIDGKIIGGHLVQKQQTNQQ